MLEVSNAGVLVAWILSCGYAALKWLPLFLRSRDVWLRSRPENGLGAGLAKLRYRQRRLSFIAASGLLVLGLMSLRTLDLHHRRSIHEWVVVGLIFLAPFYLARSAKLESDHDQAIREAIE